jgi:hypothetical protein
MSRPVIGRFADANLFQRKLFLRRRGEGEQRREYRRKHPPTPQTAGYWARYHGSGFPLKRLSIGSIISGK